MERRLYQRVKVQFEARVTNLTTGGLSAVGRVSELSNSGLSISLARDFAKGDRVQMEMADSILTGRVVHSTTEKSGFRVGIDIEKVELGSSNIAELLQRSLLESMPTLPGVESLEAHIG